jgi:hypothetical protein
MDKSILGNKKAGRATGRCREHDFNHPKPGLRQRSSFAGYRNRRHKPCRRGQSQTRRAQT